MNKDGTSRILLDHEFAMELYRRGLTDAEIAKQSGVYVKTVGKWRNRMGLPANKKRRLKMSPLARDAMEARRLGLTHTASIRRSPMSLPYPRGEGGRRGIIGGYKRERGVYHHGYMCDI